MKKLLFILFVLLSISSFSQTIKQKQVEGLSDTLASIKNSSGSVAKDTSFSSYGYRIEAWGNSLTEFEPGFPSKLRELAHTVVVNGGISGELSSDIKARIFADYSKRNWSVILWIGRNNAYNTPTQVINDLDTIVKWFKAAGNDRYLILAETNAGGEPVGSTNYNNIKRVNDSSIARYGKHYLDIRSYLVSLYDPNSPADVANHADDIPPLSLRVDSIHFNTTGLYAIADYIFKKGWPILMGRDSSKVTPSGYEQLGGMPFDTTTNVGYNFNYNYWYNDLSQPIARIQTKVWNGSSFDAGYGVGIGIGALENNKGSFSDAIGYHALRSNTGALSTGFGYSSGELNTGGSGTFYGAWSGQHNTAINSTLIGDGSGQSNTGSQSTFIGYNSGNANTGQFGVGIGTNNMALNKGLNTSSVGFAGAQYNTGNSAAGIGDVNLRFNIADYAVAVGVDRLYYNNWANRTSVGANPSFDFIENSATTKTFTNSNINVSTKNFTVTAHGFSTSGFYVNLKFKVVSGTAPGGLSDGTIYQFYVVDGNTLQLNSSGISSAGSGTFSLTKDKSRVNAVELGFDAVADTSFQFALPDNVTSVRWRGIRYVLPSSQGGASTVLTNDGSGNLSWGAGGGGGGGTTTNALTFNNGGSGAVSGTTFDGSAAKTISYNTIGAQPTLVSGTNIKTINGTSILGSGDLTISGGGTVTAVDSIWRTDGKDSIQFSIAGRYHAIKDSVGTGGGGSVGTLDQVLTAGNTTSQSATLGPVTLSGNSSTGIKHLTFNNTNGGAMGYGGMEWKTGSTVIGQFFMYPGTSSSNRYLFWNFNDGGKVILMSNDGADLQTDFNLAPYSTARSLGISSTPWSDLYLKSTGKIDFGNGNATITHSTGLLTSNVPFVVPADAYGSGWNGSNKAATQDAVYDKIESLTSGSNSLVVIDDADYTIASGVTDVILSHSTADRTFTLPAASSSTNRKITIVNQGNVGNILSFNVSIRQNSTTTFTSITQGQVLTIMSEGTQWWAISLK